MKATILDSRDDGRGKCYLCKIALEEYIQGLPSTYQDYDIQREIVTNVYLDHLVDTVLSRRHIPPIVLVVEKAKFRQKGNEAQIDTFKILDGLQRTFRLQAIRKTVEFCLKKLDEDEDYLDWNKFKLSRSFSTMLREINSNTDVLRSILTVRKKKGDNALLEAFEKNDQWFEIVYAVRNAIVHNKETEFHLTYATLDTTICTLIESFVIPCLEEMCFALVGNRNQHVWYANREILLYK